jgi:proteic killer suppression protein
MIESFRCKETEKIWNQIRSKKFSLSVQKICLRKLFMIHRAKTLTDLKAPPANRLEMLKGDRSGQYSIRINSQWRICFIWKDGNAYDVEIADYH